MEKAILGRKIGMTQIFDETGLRVPVTVVEAGPMTVVRHKTQERDGYEAVLFAFEEIREDKLNSPERGLFKKNKLATKRYLKEFRLNEPGKYEVGTDVKVDIFTNGDMVDVSGTSKGHGFTGAVKRHNKARLKMTHGTGPVHRSLGSTGANSNPSKKIKNLKMAGQMGNEKVTIQNLQIVKVDADRNVLLIKGAVPGPKGGLVTVCNTVKK
ncbi:MAG: 50S ribosomal protein L3 [Firmicutes bacterium]|nr:50S ribosomal protein L3 [Bacillota bacterium]